ncbi:MAG TPA: hypothetical protein VHG08_26445 [Longimicrobium sp.]|nr:hypothetical protein [Longimicrobium sp.]
MDYKRITLAAVVAWFVNLMYGLFGWMAMTGDQFAANPATFRTQAAVNANIPLMLAGELLAMFVLAIIYARGYEGGSGLREGFRFGVLMAVFMVSFASIGLYGSLNIDAQSALLTATRLFVQMVIAGTVIGMLYRPAAAPKAGIAAA